MSTEPQQPTPATPAPAAPAPATTTPTAPAAAATAAPPAAPAEPNALASALTGFWDQFKSGQLISYRLMALILVTVAGIGTYVYIARSNRKTESSKWAEVDLLVAQGSPTGLEDFAKKDPDGFQGRVAALAAAHQLLGPDGIDQIPLADEKRRTTLAANIEKARDEFGRLADAFKDTPDVRAQCLYARAKAELALVGLLKPGSLDKYYGDPKKAAEYLDEAAGAFPETDLAKSCQKTAAALRDPKTDPSVLEVQRAAYLTPKAAPKSPFGGMGLDPFSGGLGGPIGP